MGVARKSLIYDNSFDLPSSANQDLLIGLRLLIRTLRNIMKGEYCTSDVTHYIIAIDSNQRNRDTHLKYCRLNGLAPFSEMCTLEDSFNMKKCNWKTATGSSILFRICDRASFSSR